MIDLKAARELKREICDNPSIQALAAAQALIASIEDEYGDLDEVHLTPEEEEELKGHQHPLGPKHTWTSRFGEYLFTLRPVSRSFVAGKNPLWNMEVTKDGKFCVVLGPVPTPWLALQYGETLKFMDPKDWHDSDAFCDQARKMGVELPGDWVPKTLTEWQKVIHQNAVKHGWWDDDIARSFGDIVALCISELSEAFEEYRNGHGLTEIYFDPDKPDKPEGIPVEMADCLIRILDFFEKNGIDAQKVVAMKHAYNKTRPFRHGGKVV